MPNPDRDYLTLSLKQYWFAPPVALWRAIELRTAATEDYPRPILDLGCGDGLIAEALFAGEPPFPIAAGFDPWWAQVRGAPASDVYRSVQQARGDAMPYPDESFATVFSNSVLEHIPHLMPVLEEAARVLRPGGRLIVTVPSDAFRRLLAGYRDRVEVGDFNGAQAYADQIDRRLEHYRYPTPKRWAEMLGRVGMRLHHTRYYIPTEVEMLWDRANARYGIYAGRGHWYRLLASPRFRRLGYQGWLRRWIVRRLSRRWRAAYEKDVPTDGVGGGLLVVGEKE
jgi:SAM-dependent methyltransferase